MNLKDRRSQLLGEAQATVTKAKSAGRDLTPDEAKSCEAAIAEAKTLGEKIDKAEADQDLIRKLGAMGLANRPFDQDGFAPGWGVDGEGFARLRSGAKALGRRLAAQVPRDGGGRKALVGGGAVTTVIEVDQTPIPLGQPAMSLFDVLPVHNRTVPNYKYFRQSVRDNNAAVVAPGAAKPVSTYTISGVDGELVVIAHLSESIDSYLLGDDSALGSFVSSEMAYGLSLAVEAQVVADVLGTSGIQVQPLVTSDLFVTTRTAVTDLQTLGIAPGFWVINPVDWQRFELAKTSGSGEFIMESGPVELAGKRLWSTPVVESMAVPAGTGYLYGDGAVALSTDGAISLRWYERGTDFETNQITARCEGRFATDVYKPWAVVKVALA